MASHLLSDNLYTINPFKLNGISISYQLDQSPFSFKGMLRGIFHFYSNFLLEHFVSKQ